MEKRKLLNLALLGAAGLPTIAMSGPFLTFFVPPSEGGGGGSIRAKDQQGKGINASEYLTKHPAGDRSLAQGLNGDPTYIVVSDGGSIESYGVNSICTHLGCVVPWVPSANKFICPCHGSQYNNEGKVVRGPAPLSLALAHVEVADDAVSFSPWTETDFRTDSNPWWV